MVSIIVSSLAPLVVCGISFAIFYVVVEYNRWSERRTGRRSPLNRNHLRAPGEKLGQYYEERVWDGVFWFLVAIFVPLVLYSGYLTAGYFFAVPDSLARSLITSLIGLVVILYSLRRFLLIIREVRAITHGLAGERTTGEELNQLMLNGCRVFHDVEVDYGNIDHVVIAPTGIFAVETKSRGKPQQDDNYTVVANLEDNTLKFPGVHGRIDTDQLEAHRRWLTNLVRDLCGVELPVTPVLALPGWNVKRKGYGDFLVMNPRNPQAFLLGKRPRVVSETQIGQIARALEDRVRNVQPLGTQ